MDSSSSSSSYPWPSSVNVANFVTVKLGLNGDERNDFEIWKMQMKCLLESQDVMGFVDGEIIRPPDNDDAQKLWRRTDALIRGWLLGSIGKDALLAVCNEQTARGIWLRLDKIFKDEDESGGGDYTRYLSVYRAAQRGDWEFAKNFFQDIEELGTRTISSDLETALHVAVLTGKANNFVEKLVELLAADALARKDSNGDTALHNAALVGNTEAAKIMVNKNPQLLHILNKHKRLAVNRAAAECQKDTLKLLISMSEQHQGQLEIRLLIEIISSEFLDVALDLVEKYPNLAVLRDEDGDAALSTLAVTDTLFPRFETFSWWEHFIYHCIPIKKYKCEVPGAGDIENNRKDSTAQNYCTLFRAIFGGKLPQFPVPKVQELRKMKTTRQQALQLAEYLCEKLESSPEASTIFRKAIKMAAKYGISEIVEMIIRYYPEAALAEDSNGMNVFLLAASHRFENIINLLNNMSDRKYLLYDRTDDQDNNLMHICGKLAPSNRLNLVPGAALQMQRELQWFKEMETFVNPSRRTWPNKENQTPQMIFTKEHENLKAAGEKWMKDTANACTIAAALIATVMFAAAFTVPGGLKSDTGIPLFTTQPVFDLFAVSDAISLFTSIFSLLMFLSILTSRYAENDFLHILPRRLSMGLFSLFVSITSMMVAFSATFDLVFRRDSAWYLQYMAAFAVFPVTSFVLLQFPLLFDVVYLTYGPGIFGKKTRFLY